MCNWLKAKNLSFSAEFWSNPEYSMQIEEVSITARPYFNMHKIYLKLIFFMTQFELGVVHSSSYTCFVALWQFFFQVTWTPLDLWRWLSLEQRGQLLSQNLNSLKKCVLNRVQCPKSKQSYKSQFWSWLIVWNSQWGKIRSLALSLCSRNFQNVKLRLDFVQR